MQLVKRVIQAAKEQAQVKYLALTRLMVKEAEEALIAELAEVRPNIDRKLANAALVFLRMESGAFLGRMETLFRESVERALRTMYNDLRRLDNLSADNLSLVDDETVIKQMEVGNLVTRLRDACDENLGRLNIMIAQVHGDTEVHERENPFRPYLVARALYEALREKVKEEDVAKVLFSFLANSMAKHLSDFYASICDVFEASGIRTRLQARPTQMKQHQRDFLARQLAEINANSTKGGGGFPGGFGARAVSPEFNERVMPSLQRMQELVQENFGSPGRSDSGGSSGLGGLGGGREDGTRERFHDPEAAAEEFQDFVWKMFNQRRTEATPTVDGALAYSRGLEDDYAGSPLAPASPGILSRLDEFQQMAASGKTVAEQIPEEGNQLFAVSDKLATEQASPKERIAIDVIAVLFEFILEDEQIPADMRLHIGRLQIPLLKAAMLWPELLQDAEHPARKLLNRMSSAVVGVDFSAARGQQLKTEIERLVKKVLAEFDKDVGIFSECLRELEAFLGGQLRNVDSETALSIEAVEEAEKASLMLAGTVESLRNIVEPLRIDQRVVDFMLQVWARVLVRASLQDLKAEPGSTPVSTQYRDVLPELAWSAQEKQTPEDRSALIRLLPSLVKRLRIGMLMIHLSEDECKAALDRLVEMHTFVLRPNQVVSDDKLPTLEEFRQQFTRLVTNSDDASWTLETAPPVPEEVVETLLADKGTEAELALEPASPDEVPDAELLSQVQLGNCVQCWAADTHVMARVIWVSRHRSLFIFKMEVGGKPLVYSAASLVKALREGAIQLVEYAPVFDRAVDSLMFGAEQVGKR